MYSLNYFQVFKSGVRFVSEGRILSDLLWQNDSYNMFLHNNSYCELVCMTGIEDYVQGDQFIHRGKGNPPLILFLKRVHLVKG